MGAKASSSGGSVAPPRRRRRSFGVAAAIGATALLVTACGSSGSAKTAGNSTGTQPAGKPATGGTVTWAELPAATPNYIFPMAPFADFSVANLSQFQELFYRPLYWFGTGGKPTVDYTKSVGQKPVFTNGDKTVTITLNHYVWSDGETVNARDVIFWMNMLKAEKTNWAAYAPGYFPDNVASMSMPKGPTGNEVEFQLTTTANPTWFTYNELSQITPLPIAWDRTSMSAAAPSASATNLPDTTTAGAKAVYSFLVGQAKDLTTYATSPIWSVIDGPWKLAAFTTSGEATFVPNPKYVGPDHPYLSKFIELPYTTDTAEFNTIKSGSNALTVGFVPAQDMPKLSDVQSEGYTALTYYPYAFNYLALNFTNPTASPLFKQLYLRQAMQQLINQPGWTKAYYNGLAAPTFGPVPVEPSNPFADSFEKSNPYPFDTKAAAKLLSAHGWDVKAGGTTTCTDPAKCGAGIKAGQPLTFTLDYASGSVPLTSSMADLKSVAATVGIQLDIVSQDFDTVIGEAVPSSKTWQIANWGAGWIYSPDYYASGEELFATGAGSNSGAYDSPEANRLIAATTSVGQAQSQSALDAYQNYIAKQLPVLYQPAPATEIIVSKKLGGTVLAPNAFENLDPESWYFIKKS
jgi:peptide/nickel transport system substrate-binding protein